MTTICIAGKNDIAVDILSYCLDNFSDCRVVTIVARNDYGISGWQKSLLSYAKRLGVEVVSLDDIYEIRELVFISAEYDRIINPQKFASNRLFNIHFSLLPKYKGCHTSVLPILHGCKDTGVTLHRIDSGIDTGDIIDQLEVGISVTDTSYTLYKKLMYYGALLLKKNLRTLIEGKETSFPQDCMESSYYSRQYIDFSKIRLDINTTAFMIQNQIRAFCFRPYQVLKWEGNQYIACEILEERSKCRPGEKLKETDVYTIATSIDYNVILYKDVLGDLIKALKRGDDDEARRLCATDHIINDSDENGYSPFMIAASVGNEYMTKYLLGRGADIKAQSYDGKTAIILAKEYGKNTGNWEEFQMLEEMLTLEKGKSSDCNIL